MRYVWLCLALSAPLLAVPPVLAQGFLEPDRITNRTRFYASPVGTLAYLPQVTRSEDAKYAGQWDVLVESGRYRIAPSGQYCFVLNHRDRSQEGRSSYVVIGAISVLPAGTRPARPISMFRNLGWSRSDDPEYSRENGQPKHVSLTLEAFVAAHDQGELEENDRLLTHRWHGDFGDGESWMDRDLWVAAASAEPELIARLTEDEEGQPDLRFDAKILRFAFTGKRNSNRPVAFCMEGDRRIATIVTVFSPHLSMAERRFELVFR